MKPAPALINGARVVCLTPIDGRHRHTEQCKQIVAGELQAAAAGLSICQFDGDGACYLFGCDSNWNVITDTWHPSFAEARCQAEFEYEGVAGTWQYPQPSATRIKLQTALETAWNDVAPIRLGEIPSWLSTPDLYVTVDESGRGPLRVDLYGARELETFAFTDAQIWKHFLLIGFGHRAFIVDIDSRQSEILELGSYFCRFYASDSSVLIASGERLFCLDRHGRLIWRSQVLGVDGVVVDEVATDFIEGQGEWDPPDGWRRFRVDAQSGKTVI